MDKIKKMMEERSHSINEALERKGADFKVVYTSKFKNNRAYDGYILQTEGSSVSPIVYYSEQWWSRSDEEIAGYLIKMKQENPGQGAEAKAVIKRYTQPDYMTANVLPRLYGGKNQGYMLAEERCFVKFLDMLVGFYIPVMGLGEENSLASIPVTYFLLEKMGLQEKELLETAVRNISGESRVRDIVSLLREHPVFPVFLEGEDELGASIPMVVVSNRSGVNGAASILSRDVQKGVEGILGDEFNILPSSIHECLCCPIGDAEKMLAMVKEVNESSVPEEDRLTDSVYSYRHGIIEKIAG